MAHSRDDAKTRTDLDTLPSEGSVVDYLRCNPDFLVRNPDLASVLVPPSRFAPSSSVVDLHLFMIQRMREEMEQLHGCAEDLITTTRSNMSTQARTHQAVLAILGATSLAHLVHVAQDELPGLLDVDIVTLGIEAGDRPNATLSGAGITMLPRGMIATALGDPERPILLRERAAGESSIFGSGAGLVASYALVRLDIAGLSKPGLLGLGSRYDHTFYPGQATELLSFLARSLEFATARWLA
jgi:uncharacterized protein YigA (DUF484 family)